MKKTSRKLFAAVASLGLAVAATVGSTYAWFSMNDTVTATGMNVKAQGESTLLIDVAETTNAAGRLNAGSSSKDKAVDPAVELKPTSTVDFSGWYKAVADEASASTAKAGSYKAVEESEKESYYASYDFYLQVFDKTKTAGTDMVVASKKKDVIVDKITVTGSDTLSNCLRVGVQYAAGSKNLFTAPLYSGSTNPADASAKGVASVTEGNATLNNITYVPKTTDGTVADLTDASAKLIEGVKYNDVYKVTVFIYFDGEDAACKTDNIPAAAELASYGISVDFKLVDGAAAA